MHVDAQSSLRDQCRLCVFFRPNLNLGLFIPVLVFPVTNDIEPTFSTLSCFFLLFGSLFPFFVLEHFLFGERVEEFSLRVFLYIFPPDYLFCFLSLQANTPSSPFFSEIQVSPLSFLPLLFSNSFLSSQFPSVASLSYKNVKSTLLSSAILDQPVTFVIRFPPPATLHTSSVFDDLVLFSPVPKVFCHSIAMQRGET